MMYTEMGNNKKITSFTQLRAWAGGHQLVLEVYKLTKTFPADERFALSDQLRRAIVSVTSNVAEGFSRNGKKEKVQFYAMALGSLTETQNQLLIARDLRYMGKEEFNKLAEKTVSVHKMINGLIKSAQNRS